MGKKRDYGGSEDSPDACFGAPGRAEVQAACGRFLRALTSFGAAGPGSGAGLNDVDLVLQVYKDTHDLAAPVYAASMCQEEFPSLLKTTRPWRFSGDRAPFI